MYILIVEDSETFAKLMQHWLKQAGCETAIAPTMAEAKASLSKRAPDLILLDLTLPCVQGIKTYQTMRRLAPDIETVILTGGEDDKVREQAERDGVKYILKNPISLNDNNRLFIDFLLARVEIIKMRNQMTPQTARNGG